MIGASKNLNVHGMVANADIVAILESLNPYLDSIAGMAHQMKPMGAPSDK